MIMAKTRRKAEDTFARARRRFGLLDHSVRAVKYNGDVLADHLAASVTYFAFLAFFPLVALAFSLVGFVVAGVPEAADTLSRTLRTMLPGLIGDDPNQIDVQQIADAKAGAGIIGLVGLLYAGLGWMSALRSALEHVFAGGRERPPNFLMAKLFDLRALIVVGVCTLLAIGLGSVLTGTAGAVARWIAPDGLVVRLLLTAVSLVIGIAAMTGVFFLTYRIVPHARPQAGAAALWRGALLSALGFEVLRQLANLLIRNVVDNPVYGTFAVLVALLVWIHYTAQLIMFGASWAVTANGANPAAAGSEHEPGAESS